MPLFREGSTESTRRTQPFHSESIKLPEMEKEEKTFSLCLKESLNHIMVWVGKNPKDHLVPVPCCVLGCHPPISNTHPVSLS